MDTRTAKVDVAALIEEIKRYMPDVYGQIKAKAQEVGNEAYVLVRRGLRGEPNCFYAFERGRVMGTPFNVPGTMNDVANAMVLFGCTHICIWPMDLQPAKGATDGTH
jgi:hypothetical protein